MSAFLDIHGRQWGEHVAKVRHLVKKVGAHGPRWYWQPSQKLRALGWRPQTLKAQSHEEAAALAEQINAELDQARHDVEAGSLPRFGGAARQRALARLARKTIVAERPPLRLSRRNLKNAAERTHSPDIETFIYVMGTEDGLQKIGVSIRPEERRVSLRGSSGQPLRLWLAVAGAQVDAVAAEKEAHASLASERRVGEWFAVSPAKAMRAVLQALSKIVQPQSSK